MGSEMINILQDKNVMKLFSEVMGNPESPPTKSQKPFSGRQFKIGFQSFTKCEVISLPHPSSSRGLSDDYISLFADEIGGLITGLKLRKGIAA